MCLFETRNEGMRDVKDCKMGLKQLWILHGFDVVGINEWNGLFHVNSNLQPIHPFIIISSSAAYSNKHFTHFPSCPPRG